MPNWIRQKVEIKGKNKEEIAENCYNDDGNVDFNKIVPMPEEIDKRPVNLKKHRPNKRLIEKYGADNWYSWCLKNWGTKWNASDTKPGDHKYLLSYETPWSVAIKYWEKFSELFPENEIQIDWADEFEGNGHGRIRLLAGKIIEDINLKSETAHWDWVWGW